MVVRRYYVADLKGMTSRRKPSRYSEPLSRLPTLRRMRDAELPNDQAMQVFVEKKTEYWTIGQLASTAQSQNQMQCCASF